MTEITFLFLILLASASFAVPECARDLVSKMGTVDEIYKGNICYFVTDGNKELWRSDGTEKGTYRLIDLCGTCKNGIEEIHCDGCYLYVEPSNYKGMWISDGTKEGSVHLPEMNSI